MPEFLLKNHDETLFFQRADIFVTCLTSSILQPQPPSSPLVISSLLTSPLQDKSVFSISPVLIMGPLFIQSNST
jgi:hypothetical protein